MTPIEKEELKQAVEEVIDDKLTSLFVERERHYEEHLFIRELREFAEAVILAGPIPYMPDVAKLS